MKAPLVIASVLSTTALTITAVAGPALQAEAAAGNAAPAAVNAPATQKAGAHTYHADKAENYNQSSALLKDQS